MPHVTRPRRRALRAAAVSCALLALPALAPAAASADRADANTWGGGAVGAQPSRETPAYAGRGALVSLFTSGKRARLFVSIRSDRCVVNGVLGGTVVKQPGGAVSLHAVTVKARRTVTTQSTPGRSRARLSVSLAPLAPGVLVGTVQARGRVTLRGRTRPCALSETVTVRSRAALIGPAPGLTTDPGVTRAGLVESPIEPRVRGAIVLGKRPDGRLHGYWSVHQTCRSGPKRSALDFVNVGRRFGVRADGSFRSREAVTTTAKVRGGRQRVRYVATIEGRIDPDGVARGRVAVHSRDKLTGYDDLVCVVPSTPFAAAPVA